MALNREYLPDGTPDYAAVVPVPPQLPDAAECHRRLKHIDKTSNEAMFLRERLEVLAKKEKTCN